MLEVQLITRRGSLLTPTLAILDSGADSTTMPIEWAAKLDIDIQCDCVERPCGTAGGEASGYVFLGDIEAMVLGERLPLSAIFLAGLDFVLLGRRDFFDWFRILFDQRAKTFTIERQPENPRK